MHTPSSSHDQLVTDLYIEDFRRGYRPGGGRPVPTDAEFASMSDDDEVFRSLVENDDDTGYCLGRY